MAQINQAAQVGVQIQPIHVTGLLSPLISRGILYFLIFWPFIWENGRQKYANAQLIQWPVSILQLFEPFIMLIFLIAVFLHLKNTDFLPHILIFVLLGCISGFINESEFQAILEVTYKTIRPILVLFIMTNLRLDDRDKGKALGLFFILAAINTLIMGYQFVYSYKHADSVCGLMQDSHTYANFMFIMLFFLFGAFLVSRRYSLLLLSGIAAVAAFIPQHQKAVVIGFGLIIAGFFYFLIVKKHVTLLRLVLIAILIASLGVGMYEIIQKYSSSTIPILELAWSNRGDLGFVRAFSSLISIFTKHPVSVFLGLGPGRYGSVYATIGRHASEAVRFSFTQDVYASFLRKSYGAFGSRGSLFWESTTVIAILSEYGIIGFLCIGLVFGKLLRILFSIFRESASQSLVYQSYGCILGLGFIILLALVDMITGYEIQSNIFPQMIMGGLLYVSHTSVRLNENSLST